MGLSLGQNFQRIVPFRISQSLFPGGERPQFGGGHPENGALEFDQRQTICLLNLKGTEAVLGVEDLGAVGKCHAVDLLVVVLDGRL